jgi:hypothetical protein
MRVSLARAEDYRGIIVRVRTELCRRMVFSATEFDAEPLPYAFYLFVWDGVKTEPIGMAEFFFYDQAYDSYSACSHSQALDLERVASLDRIIHVRSIAVGDCNNQTAVLLRLRESIVKIAGKLGGRYLTANGDLFDNSYFDFRENVSIVRSRNYQTNGIEKKLYLFSVGTLLEHHEGDESFDPIEFDALLLQSIRLRGRRTHECKTKVNPQLDRLLPAHWVGVWQRQLRSYAM